VLNLSQVFIILLVLLGALTLVTLLLRRILVWYAFPQADQRLMKVAYWMIGFIAILTGTAILSPITTALLRPSDFFMPATHIVAALGLLITAIGLIYFYHVDRRYAGRCPKCGKPLPGPYHLGKRCDVCIDILLHPWLIAEYKSWNNPA
jgi:hypothetical protein